MKRYLFLLLVLASSLSAESFESLAEKALAQLSDVLQNTPIEAKKVAVYDITVNDQSINAADIADRITTLLIESGRFQVIERKALEKLMEEQALSMSGAVESSEMVKAGELIGVDGFFYGSLSWSENKLVLNLRLIDTRSSAVIFSRKLEAVSTRMFKIGADLGVWQTHRYGSGWAVTSTLGNGTTLTLDSGSFGPARAMGPSFKASMRVNMPTFQTLYFGLDLGYMSFAFNNACKADPEARYVISSDTLGNMQYIDWGANIEISVLALAAEPSVHLSTKNLFGHDREIISPFAGLGLYVTFFAYSVGAWQNYNQISGGGFYQNDYPYEDHTSTTAATEVFAPFLGCDINVTRNITVYTRATYLLSDFSILDDGNYLGGLTIEMEPYCESGFAFQGGCRFYFNFL